jgi:aquaporin NIP
VEQESFRSLGPALVSGELHALWVYLLAPLVGTSLGALAYQFVRGEPTVVALDEKRA